MSKDKDSKTHRDEVFVDIVERISVTFNSSGYAQRRFCFKGRVE